MVPFSRICLPAVVILAVWLVSLSDSLAQRVERPALVIGNARYEAAAGPLKNPVNDARAVALALRSLGFEVTEKQDLTRDQFLQSVETFRKKLPGAEVALFYYAGHGIAVDGINYLIPIKSGFDPNAVDSVALRLRAETRLFNVEQIVADMGAVGAGCSLVILDACRNTPMARASNGIRAWGVRGGLVEMTPPAGSLIAFSADAGQVAYDGDGSNGLYTEALLQYLQTPGLTIEQVFKRTRAAVVRKSGGGQMPAEYSRLVGEDIYLAGLPPASVTPVPVASAPPSAGMPSGLEDISKWAEEGRSDVCVPALREMAVRQGPGDYAIAPLAELLEQVKDDLKKAASPSSRVVAALATCDAVLEALPECVPAENSQRASLLAKAHNRRGDALLLLGRGEEALAAFNAALPLAPDDAYILYNRGRAQAALGNLIEAKADFAAALDERFNQPGARKLARSALAELK